MVDIIINPSNFKRLKKMYDDVDGIRMSFKSYVNFVLETLLNNYDKILKEEAD